MPQAGADWRTWLVWLGNQVRWDRSHRHALLMYAARTGRNPVEELRRTWPPDTDSARLIIGTILRGMQALAEPTPDELAAALLSASDADRQAAQRVLADMMQPRPPYDGAGFVERARRRAQLRGAASARLSQAAIRPMPRGGTKRVTFTHSIPGSAKIMG